MLIESCVDVDVGCGRRDAHLAAPWWWLSSLRASRAAPRTPACGPERAIRISVAVPTPGSTYSAAAARAGASSRFPADDTPPPIATTCGSNVLIRFATPIPTRRPSVATHSTRRRRRRARRRRRRGRRPSRAAASSRPSADSGCAAAASRARPSRAWPAASDSSDPGCGKRGVGGRDLRADRDQRVADLAGGAGRAAVGAAVDHDAAADAGPDGDHHEAVARQARALVVGLGERGDGGVVVDEDRHPEPLAEHGAQRHVGERDVGARADQAGRELDDRGDAEADRLGRLAGGDLASPGRRAARSARRSRSGRSAARAARRGRRRASPRPTPSCRRRRRRSRVDHRPRGASYQPRERAP